MKYQPPFTVSPKAVKLIALISEKIGTLSNNSLNNSPELRKQNHIKTITSTLAIEGNTLSLKQVTDIVDGKRVLGDKKEIAEVRGAIKAYNSLAKWDYSNIENLLEAHGLMTENVLLDAGSFRNQAVGIHKGGKVIHVAPSYKRVPFLVARLLEWAKNSEEHSLIISSVLHYELEFIHPFIDGNGRMGRLWQTLILGKWKKVFYSLPLESIIKEHQKEYYSALSKSDKEANSQVFIEFILNSVLEVLNKNDQVADQVTDQVKKLLKVMKNEWLKSSEIMTRLSLSHKPTFRKNYLNPALSLKFIKMLDPDNPRNPRQKYKVV